MKKKFLDSIDVKSPCHESWDEMIGNDVVRFCSHCAKDVHNISAMNRAEAEKLVKNSNGKLCVRYVKTPAGKLLTAPPKFTQITRRASIAAGVLATSLIFSTLAYAQVEPLPKKDNSTKTNKEQSEVKQGFSIVSGIIKDVSEAVIPNAKITLKDIKTSKTFQTTVDSNGFYEFKNIEPSLYELTVESLGFKKAVLQNLGILKDVKLEQNVVLEVGQVTMGVVVVVEDLAIKTDDKPLISLPITYRDTSKLLKLKPLVPKDKKKKKKN